MARGRRERLWTAGVWALVPAVALGAFLAPLNPRGAGAAERSAEPAMRADGAGRAMDAVGGPGRGFRIERSRRFVLITDADSDIAALTLRAVEECADRFVGAMRSLDVPIRAPGAPLPIVLFARAESFYDFAARTEQADARWMGGYFSPTHGWAVLFDERSAGWATGVEGGATDAAMRQKAAHEAAHLLAFACGVESVRDRSPLWLSEGLAESLSRGALAGDRGEEPWSPAYACAESGRRYEGWLVGFDGLLARDPGEIGAMLRRERVASELVAAALASPAGDGER